MTAPVPAGDSTSQPVLRAAAIWGTLATLIITVVGILVTLGVLSSEQAAAIRDSVDAVSVNIVPVGIALVGIVGIVSGIASHLITAFVARKQVVPTDSDRYEITPKVTGPGVLP